jgi:hypothetical protein
MLRNETFAALKHKTHRGLFRRWDSRITQFDSRVLVPRARRQTDTAGTTETSLLGLLDVEIHGSSVLKGDCEVNAGVRFQ